MNKVLNKRFLRDLKANLGRYTALTLLIALGIFIIVSIVGAAETIIRRTDENKSVNLIEDGNFTVFIPLTDKELDTLTSDGTVIEEMFYTDLATDDGTTLRLMKNRKEMDLLTLDEGQLAEKKNEAVIEKRYSEENNIKIGDTVKAGGTEFKITGIGVAPDYEMPIASYSDSVIESSSFGMLFVTEDTYKDVLKNSSSRQAEEYVYGFRLSDNTDSSDFRKKIEDLDFDYEQVENKYFKESINEVLDKKKEFSDSVQELCDGADELKDGLNELKDNNDTLNSSANKLFDSYLQQANKTLATMNVPTALTKENYAEVLDGLIAKTKSADLSNLKASLDSLKEFCNGIKEYTDGVAEGADGSVELADGTQTLKDETDDLLDEIFTIDIHNLTLFVTADHNVRIDSAADDVVINKVAGLFGGIVILILFTYVISIFVIHQIEKESSVIGALYALGATKKNLMRHYVTLPVIITFIGGLIGTLIGFSPIGAEKQMADTYNYFSVPKFDVVHPAYLIIYGLILPPVICAIVNTLVINKKLSMTALSLMRNEQKASGYKQMNIKAKDFTRLFQIRQLMRESRSVITVVLGMFISIMLVELGVNIFVMCDAVRVSNVEDTDFSYMYLYKYPDKEVPDGGEEAYVETLSIDNQGYTLDVSVIGLSKNSKYFDARPAKSTTKVIVSNSMEERYHFKNGDSFFLTDSATDTSYSFVVDGTARYSPGFTVFMDIDSMRELFGKEDDYFNVVYSDKELDIDSGRLYSVSTKEDVEKASGIFVNLMQPMIILLIAASAVVFCVVMYLMIGVMIDRSRFGISLIKIFGFRTNEIKKLYLNGNFLVVAVGALICIPLGKKIIDIVYPSLISNIACTMQLSYPWYLYVIIYLSILVVYFIINKILMIKINNITPAEVLKNRE